MKQRIYLSLCLLLSIRLLTGCGEKEEPPTATVSPAPIESPTTIPSPVAIVAPPPLFQPAVQPSPVPVKIPVRKPNMVMPKSIYPMPTPVAIRVPPAPVKTKAIEKEEPVSKLKIPTDPAQQITPVGIGAAQIGQFAYLFGGVCVNMRRPICERIKN